MVEINGFEPDPKSLKKKKESNSINFKLFQYIY